MDGLPVHSADTNGDVDPARPLPARHAWVAGASVLGCVLVFLSLMGHRDQDELDSALHWFYRPVGSVWDGAYWALLTSVFVHIEILHLVFNVYWLWILGSRMERAVGSMPFLAFFVLAAVVSSAMELAVSDDIGIGASGVLYAIFGFMWRTRRHYPGFIAVLDRRTIQIILFWLAGCIVLTMVEVWNVANMAHLSGLIFGVLVAGAFVERKRPRLMRGGLAAMAGLTAVALTWCPWSVEWLWNQAHAAQMAGRNREALALYSKVLRIDPDDANAYYNRSLVHAELGDAAAAYADLIQARKLDPDIDEE